MRKAIIIAFLAAALALTLCGCTDANEEGVSAQAGTSLSVRSEKEREDSAQEEAETSEGTDESMSQNVVIEKDESASSSAEEGKKGNNKENNKDNNKENTTEPATAEPESYSKESFESDWIELP
jgi:Mg-chelatase subunit ChlI